MSLGIDADHRRDLLVDALDVDLRASRAGVLSPVSIAAIAPRRVADKQHAVGTECERAGRFQAGASAGSPPAAATGRVRAAYTVRTIVVARPAIFRYFISPPKLKNDSLISVEKGSKK